MHVALAAHDEHQQRAELRIAFLKHLPKRVAQLAQRGGHFCEHGWDINGLSLLFEDVQRIAGAAGRYGALEISERLLAVEHLLQDCLAREAVPDAAGSRQLAPLFAGLGTLPTAIDPGATASLGRVLPPPSRPGQVEPHLGRAETPPSHYWRRWTVDVAVPAAPAEPLPDETAVTLPAAGPAVAGAATAAPAVADRAPAATTRSGRITAEAPALRPAPSAHAAPVAAPPSAAASARHPARIYHLADGSDLAVELDQRLEALGHEIEILQDGDELREVLAALAPDLVIVDAEFINELESIGTVLRSTRERTGVRLRLLAISAEDSVPARLAARRAGADALLLQPGSVADVIAKVDELLDSEADTSYRVLIVEDDRSQALFAESILRNAGMEARAVDNAFEVLTTMEQFRPDLVLMDLYMPDCDGAELTALIRERDEFLHTPIVFLSGENDLDKHYAALDAGGDDFLSKPIRPKHLISAVSNRVRRARAMMKRIGAQEPKDAATGLFARSHALDRINEILGTEDVRARPGGVLFLDLDGIAALRDKLGLTGVEQLLAEAGSLIVGHLAADELATRYGDGCFVVVCPARPDGALEALAQEVRNALISHAFDIGGRPLRLRLAIGICSFRLGFADAAALLDTAERSSRDARASDGGVQLFRPARREEAVQESALVGLLRDAIEHDAFELLYQPIVAVQGGEEPQYQTLLRLRDDVGRLHTAAEIIPLAEQSDLIPDVDRWVLGQALRTLESRRQQGSTLRLFVSQAAASLATADHAEWLIAQLRARSLSGRQLVIEVGMPEVEGREASVLEFCQKLQRAGVQFCLSRFEASELGERILDQLPVDYIKLAPKYLGAVQTQTLRDELRLLVERGHRRGLLVIAQRVEDAQSAATLWMSGIDFIQGNLVQQAGRDLAFDFRTAVL
jgi:diguanylate cyclase (GGDEF)-like protein